MKFFSDILGMLFFLVLLPGLFVAGAVYLFRFIRDIPEIVQKQVIEADLRPTPPYPPVDQFKYTLWMRAKEARVVLVHDYLAQLVFIAGEIYEKEFKRPERLPSAIDGMAPYNTLVSTFLESFQDLAKANPLLTEKPSQPSMLFTEEQPKEVYLYPLAKAFHDNPDLTPYFNWKRYDFFPEPQPQKEWSADEKERRRLERDWERKEKDWQRRKEKAEKVLSDLQKELHGTPWYRYDPTPNITIKRPFHFEREHRFTHALMVGKSGAGKTTFLSVLIKEALDKVKKNEASIFVMDSQDQLIPWIAQQKIFAKGGELEGKLIYLEPSQEHPLALNIFDYQADYLKGLSKDDLYTAQQEAGEMVKFFVESLVKAEASGFVEGIINYAMRAMEKIPEANIKHLIQLLEKGEFAKMTAQYPRLKELDQDDTLFLSKRMFEGNYGQSLGSMKSRLYVFASDKLFMSMFTQRNKFDLFKELGSSKVILVNAMEGRLHASREPFGRFFIAKLLQATQQRSLFRGPKQEVYAFIDEAQDYLKHDLKFKELQQKARKQNVSFTIATHDIGEFDAPVQASLRQMAIQMFGRQQPLWNVFVPTNVPDPEPTTIRVPYYSFNDEPKMSEEEWQAILTDMRQRFCATPTAEPPVVLKPSPLEPVDEDEV